MSSVNKVIIVGNVGSDPEVRSLQSGDEVCNLSIATSESWKDKATGEKKEKTEWHRVVIFGSLVNVVKNYVAKGSKLYIEGALQTRSWDDSNGQKKYSTEIVLRGFDSKLVMLDSRSSTGSEHGTSNAGVAGSSPAASTNDLEDEIPF